MDAVNAMVARIRQKETEMRLAELEAQSRKSSSEHAATEKKVAAITEAASRRRVEPRDDDMLSTKEVADLLRVHVKTVERWTRERSLPCKRRGRSLIFRRGDVLRWQAQQES
jgi:excisionase family DNA binding protein